MWDFGELKIADFSLLTFTLVVTKNGASETKSLKDKTLKYLQIGLQETYLLKRERLLNTTIPDTTGITKWRLSQMLTEESLKTRKNTKTELYQMTTGFHGTQKTYKQKSIEELVGTDYPNSLRTRNYS